MLTGKLFKYKSRYKNHDPELWRYEQKVEDIFLRDDEKDKRKMFFNFTLHLTLKTTDPKSSQFLVNVDSLLTRVTLKYKNLLIAIRRAYIRRRFEQRNRGDCFCTY